MSKSIFPKGDPDVIKFLEKFGGWQRVLDPAFDPPEALYEGFEAAGYERQRLDRMRATEGQPERDAWMQTIARCLYDWWLVSYFYLKKSPAERKYWPCPGFPGLTPGVRWQDYPNKEHRQEMFQEVMTRLNISEDDIDGWIESHPESFRSLGSNETL